MKVTKTALTKIDLIDLLIEYKNIESDSVAALTEAADDVMQSGLAYYPNYYYFSGINGESYVLEDAYIHSEKQVVVYQVELGNDDDVKDVCKNVFKQTVGTWANDIYEAYALYRLPIEVPQAEPNASDVKIWVKYQCKKDDKNAPFDGYLKDANGAIQIFPSTQEAGIWIESKKNERYHLAGNELACPIYTAV